MITVISARLIQVCGLAAMFELMYSTSVNYKETWSLSTTIAYFTQNSLPSIMIKIMILHCSVVSRWYIATHILISLIIEDKTFTIMIHQQLTHRYVYQLFSNSLIQHKIQNNSIYYRNVKIFSLKNFWMTVSLCH